MSVLYLHDNPKLLNVAAKIYEGHVLQVKQYEISLDGSCAWYGYIDGKKVSGTARGGEWMMTHLQQWIDRLSVGRNARMSANDPVWSVLCSWCHKPYLCDQRKDCDTTEVWHGEMLIREYKALCPHCNHRLAIARELVNKKD